MVLAWFREWVVQIPIHPRKFLSRHLLAIPQKRPISFVTVDRVMMQPVVTLVPAATVAAGGKGQPQQEQSS
jgi:hypothetical protein